MMQRPLAALLLATALAAPLLCAPGPARADIFPPPANKTSLGAAAGSGVNVVTDYGADPTGAADSTAAFQNAIAAACNNASPVFQVKEVDVPAGLYTVSGTIPITNGCWLRGEGQSSLGQNAGGTVIRAANSFTSGDLFQFRGFGVLKMTDIRLDVVTFFTGGASVAQVQAGGTGYVVNDTITLACTGACADTVATVLKVTHVTAGVVDGVVITTPGTYSVAPSSVAAVAQGSTSGSGMNATFNVVYANSAAISIAGPETALTADAASGASSLTVAGIANFASGGQINIRLNTGAYYQTTVSGTPSGSTINLAGTLPSAASANQPVYGLYAGQALLQDVTCRGYWDCVRIDNAVWTNLNRVFAHDFGHDGFIKLDGPTPDGGDDKYVAIESWDQNRGTSNAGFELLAGGDMQFVAPKMLGSNYSVLLNSYYGPTGTLLLNGGSYDQAVVCSWKFHQSVSGKEYANVNIIGTEVSNISGAVSAQHLCVDTGTPNTAPKWIRNINVTGNHVNSMVTAAGSLFSIQDGTGVALNGNIIDNNGAGSASGIAVGSAAANVSLAGNVLVGLVGGLYGTVNQASLVPFDAKDGLTRGARSRSRSMSRRCKPASSSTTPTPGPMASSRYGHKTAQPPSLRLRNIRAPTGT